MNTCDALSFLTGGYVKSTIHRVAVPPKDQQHVDRLGLLYFSRYVTPYSSQIDWEVTIPRAARTMMFRFLRSKTRQYCGRQALLRMNLRRAATRFPRWKVSDIGGSSVDATDHHRVSSCAEWTFAKQKWQRTKNVARDDPNFKTAQILPGWNEKAYD